MVVAYYAGGKSGEACVFGVLINSLYLGSLEMWYFCQTSGSLQYLP
uniref:Uncharacterized protein n=1 Tax=Aegilops tauschii subsp. strangulata TaxID=200361 RepID=A0A452ZBG6_AEGTS